MKAIKFLLVCCLALTARAQEADSLLQQYAAYPDDTNKVDLLYDKAYAFRNSDLPAAIQFAKACHASALKINDKRYLAKALNICGVLKSETGLQEEALQDLQKALELRVQTGDTLSQAILLNNLGNVYSAAGQYQQALATYESALRKAGSVKNERWIQGSLFSLAELQTTMGRYRQAAGNFYTLISWAQLRNDLEILGLCYQHMSTCKINLGDTAGAEAYLELGIDVADLTDDEILRADLLCAEGRLYSIRKDHARALTTLNRALAICTKNNYSEGLVHVWKALADHYHAAGAHQEAYACLLKHDSAVAPLTAPGGKEVAALWNLRSAQAPAKAAAFAWRDNMFEWLMIAAIAVLLVLVLIGRLHEQEAQ